MRIAVIGAGNGGQATAAFLGQAGHEVRLYDRYPETIEPLRAAGRIVAIGAIEAVGTPHVLTTEIGEAMDGAELVLVSVPGFALDYLATAMAPFLRGTETVVLHPGGIGGALEVRHRWDELGASEGVVLCETDTLLFACRLRSPGQVDVKAVKQRLLIATLPASRTPDAARLVGSVFGQTMAATNVLETSLANLNPVVHPAITLTNAGRIERRDGKFEFYRDGVTASVARLLQAIDDERLRIAAAVPVPAVGLADWALQTYGVQAIDLVTLYPRLAQKVYQGIGTPAGLDARYVTEDVPMGLVPLSALGQVFEVATPTADAIVAILSAMSGTDFAATGRTAERMGIGGSGRDELLRRVSQGGTRGEYRTAVQA